MSGTPTSSIRNDTAATASSRHGVPSLPQQHPEPSQQQQQQRPSIPPPTSGSSSSSSAVMNYNHHPQQQQPQQQQYQNLQHHSHPAVSESPHTNPVVVVTNSNSNHNNPLGYHNSSHSRGNGYGGNNTNINNNNNNISGSHTNYGNTNGYDMNYSITSSGSGSGTANHNGDSTSERQRSTNMQQQQQQAAVLTNQMSSDRPSNGIPSSYNTHHSTHTTSTTTTGETPSPSTHMSMTTSNTINTNTLLPSIMSPSRNQNGPSSSQHSNNNNHNNSMTHMSSGHAPSQQQQQQQQSQMLPIMNQNLQHSNPQMQLQQQFQQPNQQQQQQYQLYQQRMQQQQQQDGTGTMGGSNISGTISLPNGRASPQKYESSERNNNVMHHPVQNTPSPFPNQSPIKPSSQSSSNKNNNNSLYLSTPTSVPGSSTKSSANTKVSNASSMPSTSMHSHNSTSKNATGSSNNSHTGGGASTISTIPQLPPEKVAALLSRCGWVDKTIWASRQLLGGQAVNGFMRATATVQRIKKQRARQNVKSGKSKVNPSTNATATSTSTVSVAVDGGGDTVTAASAAPTVSLEEQQAEENVLKNEIMNARTAKKIKQELDGGIQFCVLLHDTIRSIIQQMDPSIPPVEPLSSSAFARSTSTSKPSAMVSALSSPPPSMSVPNGTSSTGTKAGTNKLPVPGNTTTTAMARSNALLPPSLLNVKNGPTGSSPANNNNTTGSTLRRHRRTKHAPSGEILIQLPDVDEVTGKRQTTKKSQPNRLSDVIRYRALRQGDPVAARVTSRDLWILARVVKDYPGTNLTPIEFLRLSDSRREQLFKEKVLIQDVEEHDGGAAAAVLVSRSLVLPLPRNVSEAAEWGNFYRFYKKGSRVYAMYPQTTALYTATVVDCTTYCRREDDIIVVEFDGDEADPATGKLPACHIPARFVTLIPKEFPGSHAPTGANALNGGASNNSTSNSKRKRIASIDQSLDVDLMNGVLDDLEFDGDLPGFDDLDFDLLGDG